MGFNFVECNTTRHMYKNLLIILITFNVVQLFSQENYSELVTDRPDQTESSIVVPKGSFQIEMGFGFTNNKVGNNESKTISVGSTLLRYGLLENAELRFGTNYDILRVAQSINDTSLQGFTPINLGTKIYITEESGLIPELAVIVSLTMPYSSKEFRTKYLAPTMLLAASHTLSDKWAFGYNLGAFWDGENPDAIGKYSAALGWAPNDKLGMFAEFFGTFNKSFGAHAFDAGLTYKLKPNFQLDASTGIALNNNADDYFISLGFSWRLPH